MTNLIPPSAKRAVKREYLIRVLSVVGILLGVVLVLITLTAAPIYAILTFQLNGLKLEQSRQGSVADAEYDVVAAEIRTANTLADQLVQMPAHMPASVVLTEVLTVRSGEITLTSFSYVESDGVVDTVTISGVATTREALAVFKNAVERSELFAQADIPVSDLAERTDIPFSMTITLSESS